MTHELIWNGDPRYEPEDDQDGRDSAETDAEMRNDDRRANNKNNEEKNGKNTLEKSI